MSSVNCARGWKRNHRIMLFPVEWQGKGNRDCESFRSIDDKNRMKMIPDT